MLRKNTQEVIIILFLLSFVLIYFYVTKGFKCPPPPQQIFTTGWSKCENFTQTQYTYKCDFTTNFKWKRINITTKSCCPSSRDSASCGKYGCCVGGMPVYTSYPGHPECLLVKCRCPVDTKLVDGKCVAIKTTCVDNTFKCVQKLNSWTGYVCKNGGWLFWGNGIGSCDVMKSRVYPHEVVVVGG